MDFIAGLIIGIVITTAIMLMAIIHIDKKYKEYIKKLQETNCRLVKESTYWRREAIKWCSRLGELKISLVEIRERLGKNEL